MSYSAPDQGSWEQAEMLMQPAFIRLMDHLRHQLEKSDWAGEYETVNQWPADITPEMQTMVTTLHALLETSTSLQQQEQIEIQLAELPQAIPVHLLHLTKNSDRVTLNLWELCYQICLQHYIPTLSREMFVELSPEEMQADTALFAENGEVDWTTLDQKTAAVVADAFKSLTGEAESTTPGLN
jgi:hypothetical protein